MCIPCASAQSIPTMNHMYFFYNTRKIYGICTSSITATNDNSSFIAEEISIASCAIRNPTPYQLFNSFNGKLTWLGTYRKNNCFSFIFSTCCFKDKYRIAIVINSRLNLLHSLRNNSCTKTLDLLTHRKSNFKPVYPLCKARIIFQMIN